MFAPPLARIGLALLSAVLLFLGPRLYAQDADDPRPVVLTGAEVPELLGAAVTSPICYAYTDGAWAQCPLQVDERDWLDPAVAYPTSISDADELFGGLPQLLYTEPQDYPHPGFDPVVPADSDPALDGNDELVTMVRFAGTQADLVADPPPFAPEMVSEVAVEGGFLYLYVPTEPQDQTAGYDLVSYQFDLLAGTFPADYDFEGDTGLRDIIGDFLAANPEYSVAETEHYRTTFEDRWIQRELHLAATSGGTTLGGPPTYGADLLDRVKFGARPNRLGNNHDCSRSIYSASARRGTLGIQKDGPVRALRFAQGFNSGGHNYILYQMYERTIVYRMAHQMHNTPGATMFFDYSPEVAGMTYYSNIESGGVPIDGIADRPSGDYYQNAYIDWDYLLGPEGSMVSVWEVETNIEDFYPYSYFEDNVNPEVGQCTGDRETYASSGNVYFVGEPEDGIVPWTDPPDARSFNEDGDLRYLRLIRRLALDGTPRTAAEAEALRTLVETPLALTVEARPAGGAIPVELTRFDGTRDGTAVLLQWTTASETANAGFAVERAADGAAPGTFEEIAFVTGAGTTAETTHYAWRDAALPFGVERLRYRLRQVDFDGTTAFSPEVEVAVGVPEELVLHPAFPNPTAGETSFRFELPTAGAVRLTLLDALGRTVAVLAEGPREAGRHVVSWRAAGLAGGVYYGRLEAEGRVLVQRLLVLR